ADDPSADAYIAYTSGSTGLPKGIVQSHRSFVQFLTWQSEALGSGPGRRVAVWSPVSYDAHYCELLGALCSGATAVVPEAADRASPAAMARFVDRERISWFQTVPSFLGAWLDAGRDLAFDALAWVTVSGEVLPPALARGWLERFAGRGARLANLFGPSETVLATWFPVTDAPSGPVPIGTPIAGRAIALLDEAGRPVVPGAVGEIVIETRFPTRGYLGRPDETLRVFGPPGEVARIRTGDRGRVRPDGQLEFLGRRDRQVKIRGNRVELAEVEAVLGACPGVRACCVGVRDAGPRARLVGWFEGPASPEEVRRFAVERLPPAAVPGRLVPMPQLPRTVTGKLDPSSLPEPPVAPTAAPSHGLERTIATAWSEVLGRSDVGRDDNFFDLGGQSLLLAEVHDRLTRALDRPVALLALFRFPTVAALAAHLAGEARPASAPHDPSIRRASIRSIRQRRHLPGRTP
ncbi:MAG: AMP-binding protein, partial [Myxococcota bacterium]